MTRMNESDRFLAMLKAEESALISGNYTILEQLAADKERAAAQLDQHRLSAGQMQRISDQLARNAKLIRAAQDGFEQARATIRALQSQTRATVYDKAGTRQSMRTATTQLERKA